MKIALFLPSLANTGPGIVVQELCEKYVGKGHTCKVYYFDDVVQLSMACPTERITFKQPIDFSQWDIIHSHMYRPDAYVWYHKLMKHIPDSIRLVTTLHQPINYSALHTNYNFMQSLFGDLLWHRFIKAFDEVVVLNEDTAELLNKETSGLNISVIFNGRDISSGQIDDEDVNIIKSLKEKYKVIGTVSSVTKRKGLSQMVRALQYLPDYAFISVGDGDQLQELKQLASELKVEERCLWLGYRSNATAYLSWFDLFVMCTYSEGFPLALIEAAAYGLPTVLSDIPILKAIIDEPIVSFYHLEDIHDLANKIKYVYSNKNESRQRIWRYYENYLTANVMANNYLCLYGRLKQGTNLKENHDY